MDPKRQILDGRSPESYKSYTEDDDSENDAVGEEENDVSEGVEEEEDEEVDDYGGKKLTSNKSTVPAFSKASEGQSSSSYSADDSGSDSISESNKTLPSPSASDFTIKPIMSKPFDDSGKPQKSAAKCNLIPAPATNVTAGTKRTSEDDIEGKESKKKKVSNGQNEDVRKGSGRVWSEDDEIAILKGMIVDPYTEMGAFDVFI